MRLQREKTDREAVFRMRPWLHVKITYLSNGSTLIPVRIVVKEYLDGHSHITLKTDRREERRRQRADDDDDDEEKEEDEVGEEKQKEEKRYSKIDHRVST